MRKAVKRFWQFISYLGVEEKAKFSSDESKIRIFFNRCLFIGSFSIIGTLIGSYPFIGHYSLLNLITNLAIIIAFVLHVKGYFNVAKRVVVYSLYGVGLTLTALSGGDFLYHTGIITVLTFSWVMFSPKKDFFELALFSLLAAFGYLIGEFNLFDAPDFSQHPATPSTRISNLIGYTFVTLIFISFIRRLNFQYEEKLQKTLEEKELLLQEILLQKGELEDKGAFLENEISKRTSELLEQKEILEIKNSEKIVLLKEIHHRVKNNLQIIVSLLNLQSRKFEDPKVIEAIQETQNRIISMSLVHQRMYKTDDFVAIDFKNYAELLFENIRTLYVSKEKNIDHINDIAPNLRLDVETSIPLGLIINEMFTNSFKHAFNENEVNNVISISMLEQDRGHYVLKFLDNGCGLPENLEIETSDSLGLQLMEALTEQINGELKYYNEEGAVFELRFRVNN
ncbi:MAG: two-component sensor histidine kinase [Arenicella sp.]|jgi:two-component sensor histidine kinase